RRKNDRSSFAWIAIVRRSTTRRRTSHDPEPGERRTTASVDDRLHHRIFEVAVQGGVDRPLDHEDATDLLLRVHPEMGAERAVPAETTSRAPLTGGDRIHHDFHGQAETHAAAGRARRRL